MKSKYITYNEYKELEAMDKYHRRIRWLVAIPCLIALAAILLTPFTPNILLGAGVFMIYNKYGRTGK